MPAGAVGKASCLGQDRASAVDETSCFGQNRADLAQLDGWFPLVAASYGSHFKALPTLRVPQIE